MTLHLFLSNQDSNSPPHNFTTVLYDELDLSSTEYNCALKEIYFSKTNSEDRIFIFCNIIEYSLLRGGKHHILRSTLTSNKYTNPLFFKVKQNRVRSVNISLMTYTNNQFVSASLNGTTEVVLLIQKT